MIGIISIDHSYSQETLNNSGILLPQNLEEASSWKFQTTSVAPESYPSFANSEGANSGVIYDRVRMICKHLQEGMAYLGAQEKALHEITNAVQTIGQLVNKRDAGKFPRVPEVNLEAEFQILLQQITSSRNLSHFNRPLFGNSGTSPLRIHTSLSDVPRYEEIRAADLESLQLRMIYWGKVAGDGTKALISREIVDLALTHLFEVTLKCQKQEDRLKHVYQELANCLDPIPDAENPSEEDVPQEASENQSGFLNNLKEKLLNFKEGLGK